MIHDDRNIWRYILWPFWLAFMAFDVTSVSSHVQSHVSIDIFVWTVAVPLCSSVSLSCISHHSYYRISGYIMWSKWKLPHVHSLAFFYMVQQKNFNICRYIQWFFCNVAKSEIKFWFVMEIMHFYVVVEILGI